MAQPQMVRFDDALNMALEHHRAGRLAAAETIYRQILAAQPNHVGALNFLGMLAHQVGRLDVARDLLTTAVTLSPDFADAHNNLASVLVAGGNPVEAEAHYRQAIALVPAYADAHVNLGNLLWQTGKYAEAAIHCREAVRIAPDSAAAHNNLANALSELGELEEAAGAYRRALVLQPEFAGAHSNLANTLCNLGRPAEAVPHYERAQSLDPALADYPMNLGGALRDLGRLPEAVACFEQALALAPTSGEACWNLAMTLLLGGDYERGWTAYQARWETRKLAGYRRKFAMPQWDGAEPRGRTILIHAEQGLGDVIQFCRYLPLVRARGARTVLLIDSGWRQLASLMRGLDGVDQIALDPAEGSTGRQSELRARSAALAASGTAAAAARPARAALVRSPGRRRAARSRGPAASRQLHQPRSRAPRLRRHRGGDGRARPGDQLVHRGGAFERRARSTDLGAAAGRAGLALAAWTRGFPMVSNRAAVSPTRRRPLGRRDRAAARRADRAGGGRPQPPDAHAHGVTPGGSVPELRVSRSPLLSSATSCLIAGVPTRGRRGIPADPICPGGRARA
ncbi:MAG: tetratricopeptide repeat protein [Proteobacteria bacterium]|nr:tetratricopeptide repeat protein [Pseudomonadota bacterium]